jgi:argininosuccinate lyase
MRAGAPMHDTGRLQTPAMPQVQRLLLDRHDANLGWKSELAHITTVDLAHVVMLTEERLIGARVAAELLDAILQLRESQFVPLEKKPMPRGLYLAYESYLIERTGDQVGGVLHTGRSRNDLNATCQALALRELYADLSRSLLHLGFVILNRARRFRLTVMPAYTHFQAAVPITFGHYLLGLASALARDLDGVVHASKGLRRCPLGAGAVGGTTIPLNAERTAELLGFQLPVRNSVDAVASRDLSLRIVAAAAILGVTLDRAALDVLVWSTSEFGFLNIPDGLVGSSSMMPQKRNPFVLEHVQGKSAAPIGAFVGAVSAMRGTPFTNSISAGTEGTELARAGVGPVTEAAILMRFVLAGARPDECKMLVRSEEGFTNATALADRLARSGMPFRSAHYEVGAAVRAAMEPCGGALVDEVRKRCPEDAKSLADLDPTLVSRSADFGGGPGDRAFNAAVAELAAEWLGLKSVLAQQARVWEIAQKKLTGAVIDVMAGGSTGARAPGPIGRG